MSTVLVPTDFSPTSAFALGYANHLAELTASTLHVVHVYDGFTSQDTLIELKGRPEAQIRAERRLEEFVRVNSLLYSPVSGRRGDTLTVVKKSAIIGNPASQIIEMSRDPETKLIVMGGVGSGLERDRPMLDGSIVRAVTLRSSCPVLVIPQGFDRPAIANVALAFDREEDLRKTKRGFDFFRSALDVSIRFVHVIREDESREDRIQREAVQLAFNDDFPGYPVEVDLIPPGELCDRLGTYIDDRQIDLLVLGRRQHSLLVRLFFGTTTAKLLTHCRIPLLILPTDTNQN
ncbi:nucleotide-binding universal stress UspA family protein [Lewinella aquimaris]|uniref:Nucleotide-binding universal stress UspA family protein n=1 Tax=Neolewinella aquimaris TaxID=1835722 RepID=A0A840E1K1_9BACT|nr:universal stress protein [Neolewinella aquimaris]MBB4079091.1 nucleotide-binding universal stress UspA family protein [Neolewinella aquimaris]